MKHGVERDAWYDISFEQLIFDKRWHEMGRWVYIYRRLNIPMYIGKTTYDPFKRFKRHVTSHSKLGVVLQNDLGFRLAEESAYLLWDNCNKAEATKWHIFVCDTTQHLTQFEYRLIKHYQPLLNTAGK